MLSAINLKQILVEFNKNVEDNDKVTKLDNYTLENADEDPITLSDAEVDGNTVVLTIADILDDDEYDADAYPVANQDEAVLTIDAEILGDDEEFDIEFFDNQIPEAIDAKVVGSDTIKVYFSEPIKPVDYNSNDKVFLADKDNFKVDDGDYYIRRVELVNNNTEANIITYSDLDEGTVTVNVRGVKDYSGLKVASTDFEVEVVKDEEAPYVVDYKDADENGITLIFNEDIKLTEDADQDYFYHTNSRNKVDEDGYKVDGNKLTLSFTENKLPNGKAYITIDDGAVVDLWGNENDTIRLEVVVTYDEIKPEVKKVEQGNNERTVKVTFSEVVDEDTATDEDNYTLLDSKGKEVDNDIDEITLNDKGDVATIVFDDNLDGGDYSLVIEDVKDLAGNKIEKVTVDFTIKDKTEPKFEDFKAVLYKGTASKDDEYELVIRFGEKMTVDDSKYSVVDLEKYTINDEVLDDLEDVEIRAIENDKAVKIIIPKKDNEGFSIAVNDYVKIARVADAAGNYTKSLSGDVQIKASSTVGIKSANATDTETIVVTFEDLLVDFDAEELIFKAGSTTLEPIKSKTSVNSDNLTVCTYTFEDDTIDYDGTYKGVEITVSAVDKDEEDYESKNEYGETIKGASKNVADKIAPALAKKKIDNKDVDDISVLGNKVYIKFTEAIDGNTVNKYTFKVKNCTVEDAEVLDSLKNVIVLTIKNLASGDVDPDLKVGADVTQQNAIYDKVGNKVTDISSEINYVADASAEDKAAAQAVIDLINALDSTSDTFAENVAAAREAYEALTDEQKALVTNLDVLEAAEAELEQAARAAVDAVILKIVAITNPVEQYEYVAEARKAYDALTEEQKELVINYDDLEAAEQVIARFVDDVNVIEGEGNMSEKLVELGNEEYNSLGDDNKVEIAKLFIVNRTESFTTIEEIEEALTEAINQYNAFLEDVNAAEDINEMRTALESITSLFEGITLDDTQVQKVLDDRPEGGYVSAKQIIDVLMAE